MEIDTFSKRFFLTNSLLQRVEIEKYFSKDIISTYKRMHVCLPLKGVSKWAYFCIQPSSNFICLMYCLIYLLYRVIQDFVQKALFCEIQAIKNGLDNYV